MHAFARLSLTLHYEVKYGSNKIERNLNMCDLAVSNSCQTEIWSRFDVKIAKDWPCDETFSHPLGCTMYTADILWPMTITDEQKQRAHGVSLLEIRHTQLAHVHWLCHWTCWMLGIRKCCVCMHVNELKKLPTTLPRPWFHLRCNVLYHTFGEWFFNSVCTSGTKCP